MPDQPYHSPAAAAKLIGTTSRGNSVNVHTLRRWCALHAEYLSAGANPNVGKQGDDASAPRLLTDRDIEVLRTIAELRAVGESTSDINAKLATLSFAVVADEDDKVDTPSNDNLVNLITEQLQAPQDATDNAHAPLALVAAHTTLQSRVDDLARHIERVEQAQRERLNMFVSGALFGAVVVMVIVAVVLYFNG